MHDLNSILKRLQENEIIAEKFHEVETKILQTLNFKDFIEVLLTEIMNRFKVPFVWISLIEGSEAHRLIQSIEPSTLIADRTKIIKKSTFLKIIKNHTEPVLANGSLSQYHDLIPVNRRKFIKSIAIAPISLDGEIVGSFNQADISHARFQPGIDTSLLSRLALKVSISLSNVTAHEKLRFLAYHDPLTGLLNRRIMEKILHREFLRSKRYRAPLSVAFMDLNDFKIVNDTFGHDVGDLLLKFVAENLVGMSRETDIVARFAGDEFVMILPETPPDNAEILMARIAVFFRKTPFSPGNGTTLNASISYGISSTTGNMAETPEMLLKTADNRLYDAKKNKKAVFNPLF